MKVKDYIKKYSLDTAYKLTREQEAELVGDLSNEFDAIVEMFKLSGEWNHQKFVRSVQQIGDKFEAVELKSRFGRLSDSIWNNLLDFKINPKRKEEFPELYASVEEYQKELDTLRNSITFEGNPFNSDYKNFNHIISNFQEDILSKYNLKFKVYDAYKLKESEIDELSYFDNLKYDILVKYCDWYKSGQNKAQEERERSYYKEYFEQQQRQREFFLNLLFKSFSIFPSDAYNTLNLEKNATKEDVTKRYRELSLKHHPDKGGSQDMFIAITEAKNKVLNYLGV